jgi:hypothetical protein
MIPGLEEVDQVIPDQVNDPMLETEPPRPDSRPEILEGFGLSQTRERVAHHVQDNIQNADRIPPVGLDPMLKVLEKCRVEDRFTAFPGHRPPHRGAS